MEAVGLGLAGKAAGGALSAAASATVMSVIFGSYNPKYSKEDRKRMRYIQRKYSVAYQGDNVAADDAGAMIHRIDANSKLLLTEDGSRPLNPYTDERAFEDALQHNFYPVPGHQGRFVASHAMTCIGAIIDYQNQRKERFYVPGVISPGRPNDYINMFLEEMKTWCRNQLTLDVVYAEELERRDTYLTKLKNDNYYWCFPQEGEGLNIHRVIDFVHDKVRSAYEISSREEKNKSLQTLFKELNDNTNNAFEFGKTFLAYLLHIKKPAGSNLTSNKKFNGKTFEDGKLHRLLEKATDVVFKSYVEDIEQSQRKPIDQIALSNANPAGDGVLCDNYGGASSQVVTQEGSFLMQETSVGESLEPRRDIYNVRIDEYEESTLSINYVVELTDPNAHKWVVRKTYSQFDKLKEDLAKAQLMEEDAVVFSFPPKTRKMMPKKEDYLAQCTALSLYLAAVLEALEDMGEDARRIVGDFIDVKYLVIPNKRVRRKAESVPNIFLLLKQEFSDQLVARKENVVGGESSKAGGSASTARDQSKPMSKAMMEFRKEWGVQWVMKIFEAYSHLQRMAAILGWTLEINHFFVSMFGNTLAFSKLPLRDILMTQKNVMTNFLCITNDLYKFACTVNSDQNYKWHKNLQMSENELGRVKYHVDKAVGLINTIETEHLDHEAQLRRLRDVTARFAPLMSRIDGSLNTIQAELGLPFTTPAIGVEGISGSGISAREVGFKQIEDAADDKEYKLKDGSTRVTELDEKNYTREDSKAHTRDTHTDSRHSPKSCQNSARPVASPGANGGNGYTESEVCVVC